MKTDSATIQKTLLAVLISAGLTAAAHAQLTPFYSFNGNGDWSISGVGSNNTPVGSLEVNVPTGSTVQAAFLLSSTYTAGPAPDITLGTTEYSGAAWTALPPDATASYLQAFSTNVTAQIQSAVGSGSSTPFYFSDTENSNNGGTDGEVLAVVYSNPADPVSTIALLDGSLSSTGATTTINYTSPLTGVGSGFSEEMSIGDGFSYQNSSAQFSTIDVNGRRLTTSAGGADDDVDGGYPVQSPLNDPYEQDGGLITVGFGGIDTASNPSDPYLVGGTSSDNPSYGSEFSPNNPADTTHYDQELYDLGQGNGVDATPFVANGQTQTVITTQNPSGDDNIFFLGLDISGDNAVVTSNPTSTPDAGCTAVLFVLAIAALSLAPRRRLKAI